MKTVVTTRGQTVVPAALRRRFEIRRGTRLEWIDAGEEIRVIPLPTDVIRALRGSAKGEGLGAILRRGRERERQLERRRR